jgi:hypothetical protein
MISICLSFEMSLRLVGKGNSKTYINADRHTAPTDLTS